MAVSIDICVKRWVDVNTCSPNARVVEASRVFFAGPSIYSYGRHFEMARAMKDKHGKTVLWLVNGDVVSVSTGRHQRSVREHIARTDIPSVIIPFTALEAAGIDIMSVEALDVTSDRIEMTDHVTTVRPEGSRWHTREITEYCERSDDELDAIIARRHAAVMAEWERMRDYARDEPDENGFWHSRLKACPEPPEPMTRERLPQYERMHNRVVGTREVLMLGSWREIAVTVDDDGVKRYRWQTQRHWLGESLIRGSVTEMRTHICPACRGKGTRTYAPPPPRERGWRVTAPIVVTRAWERWIWDEERQAIRDWDRTWGPRGDKACTFCLGDFRRTERITRTAKFLSGFDRNESRPSYFFCELPRTRATDIESALDALKPDTVRMAEQMGRDVMRQGDIFAVAMPGLSKRDLSKLKATYAKGGRLFGTNHAATETATLPDGTLLARGCIRHVPDTGRPPDHARINLGAGWRVIVKNTVPLARA